VPGRATATAQFAEEKGAQARCPCPFSISRILPPFAGDALDVAGQQSRGGQAFAHRREDSADRGVGGVFR